MASAIWTVNSRLHFYGCNIILNNIDTAMSLMRIRNFLKKKTYLTDPKLLNCNVHNNLVVCYLALLYTMQILHYIYIYICWIYLEMSCQVATWLLQPYFVYLNVHHESLRLFLSNEGESAYFFNDICLAICFYCDRTVPAEIPLDRIRRSVQPCFLYYL